MRQIRILILFLMTMGLVGCASHLNQQQCATMDWNQSGVADGAAGKAMRDLQKDVQDCAKFNITVNTKAYMTGWKKGMKQFCTPSYALGLADGEQGRSVDSILGRQQICSQHGFKFTTAQYVKGNKKGLVEFCTYDRGEEYGERGTPAVHACQQYSTFMRGWSKGLLKFCTYDRGQDEGVQGRQPLALCDKNQDFMQGWKEGARQFCSDAGNGFSLGRDGKPYPSMCPSSYYRPFKTEYDRGMIIHQRAADIQRRINVLNDQINYRVNRFRLRQVGDDYRLGHDRSQRARIALLEVHRFVRAKHRLEEELFQTKVS